MTQKGRFYYKQEQPATLTMDELEAAKNEHDLHIEWLLQDHGEKAEQFLNSNYYKPYRKAIMTGLNRGTCITKRVGMIMAAAWSEHATTLTNIKDIVLYRTDGKRNGFADIIEYVKELSDYVYNHTMRCVPVQNLQFFADALTANLICRSFKGYQREVSLGKILHNTNPAFHKTNGDVDLNEAIDFEGTIKGQHIGFQLKPETVLGQQRIIDQNLTKNQEALDNDFDKIYWVFYDHDGHFTKGCDINHFDQMQTLNLAY